MAAKIRRNSTIGYKNSHHKSLRLVGTMYFFYFFSPVGGYWVFSCWPQKRLLLISTDPFQGHPHILSPPRLLTNATGQRWVHQAATRCRLWTWWRKPSLRIPNIQQALSMKWCLDFCALLVAQTFFLMTHLEAPPPNNCLMIFADFFLTRQEKWACPTTILLLLLLLTAVAFQEYTMTFPSSAASPLSHSLPITTHSTPPPRLSKLGKELQKF